MIENVNVSITTPSGSTVNSIATVDSEGKFDILFKALSKGQYKILAEHESKQAVLIVNVK